MQPRNPKTIELDLDSGIRVWVTPLNRYQLKALGDAANEKHPLPEAKAFEAPIADPDAIAGLVVPADQNPEYLQLKQEAEQNQQVYIVDSMIDLCVEFPDFESREALILHFADYIAKQRRLMTLPADAWEATWRFAILRTTVDEGTVIMAVKNELPLTEAEVVNEITIFRRKLSGSPTRKLFDGQSQAQRATP